MTGMQPVPAALQAWGMAAFLWAAALGYWDLRYRRLPNVLTLGAALAALVHWAVAGTSPLGADGGAMLAGAGLALALTLPGCFLGKLGTGDAKLLLAIGLLGGTATTLVSFVVAALAAGVTAGAWVLLGPRLGRPAPSGKHLPFGAALALGFAVALLAGRAGALP